MKKTIVSVAASITVLVVATLVIGFDEMMKVSQELLYYSAGVFAAATISYYHVLVNIERASVDKQKEGFVSSSPKENTSFLLIYCLALMAVVSTPNEKFMLFNMWQLLVPALFLYSFLFFKDKKWYIGLFYPVRWNE